MLASANLSAAERLARKLSLKSRVAPLSLYHDFHSSVLLDTPGRKVTMGDFVESLPSLNQKTGGFVDGYKARLLRGIYHTIRSVMQGEPTEEMLMQIEKMCVSRPKYCLSTSY